MTKILIADDHAIIRQGIKVIIATDPEFEVIAEADNFGVIDDLLKSGLMPDVIVMDLSMPGGNAFDVVHDIKNRYPNIFIIILSMHSEEQYAGRAIKAGASSYLNKECAPEQLVNAIHSVIKNTLYLTPKAASAIAEQWQKSQTVTPDHGHLSNREFQVLLKIAAGEPLTKIANHFDISIKTVSSYRARILKKMNMTSNAELVQYVVRKNLLSPQPI